MAFGEALGWMQDPASLWRLWDVHGAGAQRSDPKSGDPADWPYGHGPTATFSATQTGTFAIGLVVYDGDGAQDTDTATVTVTGGPNQTNPRSSRSRPRRC